MRGAYWRSSKLPSFSRTLYWASGTAAQPTRERTGSSSIEKRRMSGPPVGRRSFREFYAGIASLTGIIDGMGGFAVGLETGRFSCLKRLHTTESQRFGGRTEGRKEAVEFFCGRKA